jgi:hypothetical protein
VKLTTIRSTRRSSTPSSTNTTASIASGPDHLLCLNQQEALMLFGLLQAAMRHEPTRRTLLSSGDYKHFHRQLSQVLAEGLSAEG